MFIKPAELANDDELNLNNSNNINDFNHLIDIDPDIYNANLQHNCFSVEASNFITLFISSSLNRQLEITDHFCLSVIGICETKIANEIETSYNIAGYNLFTNNKESNKGGVALYIKNNIPVMVKPEKSFTPNGIETTHQVA